MKRIILRGLLIGLSVVLTYQLWLFGHVWWWVNHNPTSSAMMDERLSQMRATQANAQLQYQWVPYNRISDKLKRAVISSEDANFLSHHGFDWEGIQTAAEKDLKHGKIVAGGSTISQQLAKNLLLSDHRTPWRKLEEVAITMMLEKMMSKHRILELYLNVIEWGNGVFGAQAAANHYFHVSANHLSDRQAAQLAVMVPNPRYYDDHRGSRELQRRTYTIMARMNQVSAPK